MAGTRKGSQAHTNTPLSVHQLQPSTLRFTFTLYDIIITRLTALCPGLPGWAGTRKVKPVWILLKQETVSGSGISWAICKSAHRSRQITTPEPHHSVGWQERHLACKKTDSVKVHPLWPQYKTWAPVCHAALFTVHYCLLTFIQGNNSQELRLHGIAISRADFTDSPDCLLTLLSMSVFYFSVFLFFPLFSWWFRVVE